MLKKLLYWMVPVVCISCAKYLDKKPDGSLTTPSTLNDLQAMLDFNYFLNQGCPGAGEVACDNFYITNDDWMAAEHHDQQNYIWGDDVFNEYDDNDWNEPYQWVLYANEVLQDVSNITPATGEQGEWNNIKGSGLFVRAHAFYWLAQEFCVPYNASTSANDLGIALRLTSDINALSIRASVEATYAQIISDLKEAAPLLPVTPSYKTRPSKPAAFALLARTFLAMQNYTNAQLYADSCLQLNNKLIDYNSLNPDDYNPVPRFNDEVIYQCVLFSPGIGYPPTGKIDSALYALYDNNDLRKTIFYKSNDDGTYSYYGSYDGTDEKFSGIATDEIYFIKAECEARAANKEAALTDLNTILVNRYKAGSFIPLTASTAEEVLNLVLKERRKELVWRNLRWTDLRRLNTETHFATTIARNVNGTTYTLLPGDARYVFEIPEKVIQLSGMQQNPR